MFYFGELARLMLYYASARNKISSAVKLKYYLQWIFNCQYEKHLIYNFLHLPFLYEQRLSNDYWRIRGPASVFTILNKIYYGSFFPSEREIHLVNIVFNFGSEAPHDYECTSLRLYNSNNYRSYDLYVEDMEI